MTWEQNPPLLREVKLVLLIDESSGRPMSQYAEKNLFHLHPGKIGFPNVRVDFRGHISELFISREKTHPLPSQMKGHPWWWSENQLASPRGFS